MSGSKDGEVDPQTLQIQLIAICTEICPEELHPLQQELELGIKLLKNIDIASIFETRQNARTPLPQKKNSGTHPIMFLHEL